MERGGKSTQSQALALCSAHEHTKHYPFAIQAHCLSICRKPPRYTYPCKCHFSAVWLINSQHRWNELEPLCHLSRSLALNQRHSDPEGIEARNTPHLASRNTRP